MKKILFLFMLPVFFLACKKDEEGLKMMDVLGYWKVVYSVSERPTESFDYNGGWPKETPTVGMFNSREHGILIEDAGYTNYIKISTYFDDKSSSLIYKFTSNSKFELTYTTPNKYSYKIKNDTLIIQTERDIPQYNQSKYIRSTSDFK